MTKQVKPSETSPEAARLFETHFDGLGTFLDIAHTQIKSWSNKGELTKAHIETLEFSAQTALINLGASFELLGMERIDHTPDIYSNYTLAAALATAGRAMREFANMRDTLESATRRIDRKNAEQGAAKQAETMQDVFNRGA